MLGNLLPSHGRLIQMTRSTTRCVALGTILFLASSCSSTGNDRVVDRPASTQPAATNTTPASATLEVTFAYSGPDGHIWTVNASTGARSQVTHGNGGIDFDPHWSPDGRQLVFRTERFHAPDPTGTGYNGIFVVRADGTDERAINPPGGGLFPAWSPDGATIMFSSPRPDGSEGLFSVHPDGTGLRDLATYGEHVAWSPDGTQLLVDRKAPGQPQNWDIWRSAADLHDLRQLTMEPGDDHFGAWSRDGRRIVFTTHRSGTGDVWTMNSDGSQQRPLVVRDGAQSAEAWLPDGHILFTDYPPAGGAHWYAIGPDGTGLRTVPVLEGIQGPVDWTRHGH